MSDEASRAGLSETLFARAHAKWNAVGVAKMLTVQYRMNERIMRWASDEMYEGKLVAAPTAARRVLGGVEEENGSHSDGSSSDVDPKRHPALVLVDTAGCDMEEHCEEEGDSKDNPGEAAATMALVRRLIRSGAVDPSDVGVITPYSAQVGVLRDFARAADESLAKVEMSTVDGFQGREKEAIIISAVRSNAERRRRVFGRREADERGGDSSEETLLSGVRHGDHREEGRVPGEARGALRGERGVHLGGRTRGRDGSMRVQRAWAWTVGRVD